MSDNLLPPTGDDDPPTPTPTPVAPRRTGIIQCEFCQCGLTPAGEVLTRGDKARSILRLEDKLDSVTRELTQTQEELARVKDELRQAKIPNAKPARSGYLGID